MIKVVQRDKIIIWLILPKFSLILLHFRKIVLATLSNTFQLNTMHKNLPKPQQTKLKSITNLSGLI